MQKRGHSLPASCILFHFIHPLAIFIKTCISNEKLPNFTRINLHSNDIQKKYIKTIRSEITNEVLNSKIKSKKRFEQELTKLQNKLFDLKEKSLSK